ncbi:hypothetical protein QJ857_gp0321 [Tupanvirus soda lake]|uniref:Dynamin N-terminal domain-containing protein n=2 Tax=Tupanvirus TaxID=2094720 RepID=A0A6N1NWP6_9VIRU|nr:hypothetical protein QJ857_gp0321 [Tupanvirus soda lake]QKU35708.1 hypothetical protein [Tupanvirus soda lake]
MGGGGSREVHHHHTVYQVPPETKKVLEEQKKQLEKFEEEAMKQSDPKLFKENSDKLMDNFVEQLKDLKLSDIIVKKTGEHHIGFIGQVSAGKTSMINALFGLKLPVALGHCTEECRVVHQEEHNVIWDVCGQNDDFKFYKPENLSFIKDLDVCVILFDNDISMISHFLRVVHKINPDRMVIVRTKVDQHTSHNSRSVIDEKFLDGEKVKQLLGVPMETYCVSSHNIMYERGERYDWDVVKRRLGLTTENN